MLPTNPAHLPTALGGRRLPGPSARIGSQGPGLNKCDCSPILISQPLTTHMCAHTQYTLSYTHMQMYTHTHSCAHIHIQTIHKHTVHTCALTCTLTPMCAHTCKHEHTRVHARVHTCARGTHTPVHAHSWTLALHTYTLTCTHTHVYLCTGAALCFCDIPSLLLPLMASVFPPPWPLHRCLHSREHRGLLGGLAPAGTILTQSQHQNRSMAERAARG